MTLRSDSSTQVLSALQLWQTFEYLSPQNPPPPELKKNKCVWVLDSEVATDASMPWKDPKKAYELRNLFEGAKRFMLYAGVISGEELVEAARSILGAPPLDLREQRTPKAAASIVIPVDAKGIVSGSVFISTIPWAFMCIRRANGRGDSFDFSGFFGEDGYQERTSKLVDELLLQRQLIKSDPDEEESSGLTLRSITPDDVRAVCELVFRECGWAPSKRENWTIETKKASEKGVDKRPEDPLNSFYAEDLERVQAEYKKGNYGLPLKQYLEMPVHPERIDLDKNKNHLIERVHPKFMPLASWPGKNPLVTAQQFAVNTVMQDITNTGLFSVNGPPGTGKTTMLKDILSAIVQKRADALCSFTNALDAFPSRITIEGHKYPVWQIHPALQGFGIVVASANNGAVENISKELPGLGEVDPSIFIDCFSEVADSIALSKKETRRSSSRKHWGLISAVLGNQENKSKFVSSFWDAPKTSSKNSKQANIDGNNFSEAPDPLRPMTLQDWVAEFGHTVPSWDDARESYQKARNRVTKALEQASLLAEVAKNIHLRRRSVAHHTEQIAILHKVFNSTEHDLNIKQSLLLKADADQKHAVTRYSALNKFYRLYQDVNNKTAELDSHLTNKPTKTLSALESAKQNESDSLNSLRKDLDRHNESRPHWFLSLFNRKLTDFWISRSKELTQLIDTQREKISRISKEAVAAKTWGETADLLTKNLIESKNLLQAQQLVLSDLKITSGYKLDDAKKEFDLKKEYFEKISKDVAELDSKREQIQKNVQSTMSALNTAEQLLAKEEKILASQGLLGVTHPSWYLNDLTREDLHKTSPYRDRFELFEAQRLLFVAAMNLHKAFIVAAWSKVKPTIYATCGMLSGQINPNRVHGGPMPLWDALFCVVPLVSTTFASFPRLFKGVGREQLAWLFIDEAGQATPQQAVGAIWRAKRAVVVGDPLQIAPVVGVPQELVEPLRSRCKTEYQYVPPFASAQTLADQSNRYGTYLRANNDEDNPLWLGSPLVVHRRCLNPMFDIANTIAYEGKMVYGTGADSITNAHPSVWVDVVATGNDDHWIEKQGQEALKIISSVTENKLRDDNDRLRVYVVTPFRSVSEKMIGLLGKRYNFKDASDMCGTVHTFQGKEADFVIFLLGGDPKKPGVISSYAGKTPNLVNVAVTRAKKRLYVVGDRKHWTGHADINRYFSVMAEKLG